MDWPIFNNKEDLKKSKWGNYFKNLYGEIPNTEYPIDMSKFWLLYTDLLKNSDIKIDDKCIVNNNYDKCQELCPSKDGNIYSNMSYTDDMENTIWIYHKPPYKPLKNNSNVEVTHVSGGYPGSKIVESVGSWYYYAPGSGMYLNLGKTISFKDHNESVKFFLNIDSACIVLQECATYFPKLFKKAKSMGYDTIQYLNHTDMRCGNTAIEIVDLNGVGAYPCGNKNKININSGWNGTKKCICNNKKQSLNCLVNNKIIGGYDVFHRNIISDITYLYYHKFKYLSIINLIIYIVILILIVLLFIYRKKLSKFIRNIH